MDDEPATLSILADHCVGTPTITLLQAEGYPVRRLVDVGDCSWTDQRVVAFAREAGWVLLTQDRDFRLQQRHPARKFAGIILLTDMHVAAEAVHRRLLRFLASADPADLPGSLIRIVRRSTRRIR